MDDLEFWWGGHRVRCEIDAGPVSAGAPAIPRNASWRLYFDGEDQGLIGEALLTESAEEVVSRAISALKDKFGPGLPDEPIGPSDIGEQYGEDFAAEFRTRTYFVKFVLGPNQAMGVPLNWSPGSGPPPEQFWQARVYPPGRPDLARSVEIDPEIIQRQPEQTELEEIVRKAFG